MEKHCNSCKVTKPICEFSIDNRNVDKLDYFCKQCKNKKARENCFRNAQKSKHHCKICGELKLNRDFKRKLKLVCLACFRDKKKFFQAKFQEKEGVEKKCIVCNRKFKGERKKCAMCRKPKNRDYFSILYQDLKTRCRRKNLICDVDAIFLKAKCDQQLNRCFYSQINFQYSSGSAFSPTIDRVDNNKGYIKDNVVVCSKIANFMKLDQTLEMFKSWVRIINNPSGGEIFKLNPPQFKTSEKFFKCASCKIEKDSRFFTTQKDNITGFKKSCTQCLFFDDFDHFLKRIFNNITAKFNKSNKAEKRVNQITIEDVKNLYEQQNGKCAISGIPMTRIHVPQSKLCDTNISIDRIDSKIGYTKDNIQLVCARVNSMKSTLSMDEFKFVIKSIYNNVDSF
jgi:hypothetical protein